MVTKSHDVGLEERITKFKIHYLRKKKKMKSKQKQKKVYRINGLFYHVTESIDNTINLTLYCKAYKNTNLEIHYTNYTEY